MIRSLTPLFLFVLLFSCRGKIQHVKEVSYKDTALKILIWGLPNQYQQIAMDAAAKNYGFEYHRIAGCVISKNLEDSTNRINEQTSKILQAKFGNDWKIQIDKKVDEIMDSLSQARINNDRSKVEVIGADGKPVDFSKNPVPPPPTKEDQKRERASNKKKEIVKIVKDCCTAEDSLEPKPPIVDK